VKAFRDNAGREWLVSINVAAVKRCRDLAGTDLYGLVQDRFKGLADLMGDPVRLVDVLYVLCRDEATQRGITDEDFGRAMAGDAITAATDAFLVELTDFFPDPRVRAGLQKVFSLSRTVADQMMTAMTDQIATIDPDTIARQLIASSGSLPASSGSTPAP
jgi:hypothetical protein